ncbi:MAG TPA: hypothetical protein ENK07_07925 [Bacteroidetes bacterium]|nr:hypothetical protein [Bacteroidota bacterium]
MGKRLVLVVAICASLLGVPELKAQNFDLHVYTPDELDAKANQVADFLGAVLPGGMYHTAKLHGIGGFDAGVRFISVFIPSEYKDAPAGPLAGKEFLAVPMLHASLGLPGPLEIMVRGISVTFGDEPTRGTVQVVGAALKWGLVQQLLLPRVTLIGAFHHLTVPETFDIGTTDVASVRIVVSKGLPFFGFYGGLGFDWTKMQVKLPESDLYPLGFSATYNRTGANAAFGFTFSPFPFIKFNLDYSVAKFSGFNAGLTFSFR